MRLQEVIALLIGRPWFPLQDTLAQRFPTFWLAEPFLESISMAEPLAYPMSYKLMVFRGSVTGGGREDR